MDRANTVQIKIPLDVGDRCATIRLSRADLEALLTDRPVRACLVVERDDLPPAHTLVPVRAVAA